MAEQETREQAQERFLTLQEELMGRLEANPKYQALEPHWQNELAQSLMPQFFDPRREIAQLLKSIQVCKSIIGMANILSIRSPENSELCAEVVEGNRQAIQEDLKEIKRIQKGDFEWLSSTTSRN